MIHVGLRCANPTYSLSDDTLMAAALDGTGDRAFLEGLSADALMAAALACTDAADFRRRALAQRGR